MSYDEEVALEDYTARMKVLVDDHNRDYKKNNNASPEDWPIKMTLGEWDQDFLAFMMTDEEE